MSLIDRLREGDVESLGLLVKECKEVCVNHLIRKTTCDIEAAEEIFTEAVLDFGEKVVAGKVKEINNLKGYMTGTCYNMWLSQYRNRHKNNVLVPDIETYFYDYMEPEKEVSLGNFREQLFDVSEKAMKMLSESCQTVIRYFYLEERSMKDIAQLMGLASVEVARATKYKCFKKLRQHVTILENEIR